MIADDFIPVRDDLLCEVLAELAEVLRECAGLIDRMTEALTESDGDG